MIYLTIFISKMIENTLATLRIILVSNGKKKLGALLQGLIMLVWILVTGYVIIDINKNIFNVIPLCLGSVCGSYLGSLLEEKIALGSVKLDIITNKPKEIYNNLSQYNINIHNNLSVITSRRNINNVVNKIKSIDKSSQIISEKIKIYDK